MSDRPLNKFDWIEALVSSPAFKTKCGAIRTGTALAICYFNEQQGMAWPSRAELAQRLNSAPERVSEWISELREAGALITRQQGKLASELRKSSDPRSLVYVLNMEWAERILDRKSKGKGLQGKAVPRGRKVTRPVTEPMTRPVTVLGDEARHTDKEGIQIETERPGAEVTELGVYARSLEELPYDPPHSDELGEDWLIKQGVDERNMAAALKRLMGTQLYPSDLKHLRKGAA